MQKKANFFLIRKIHMQKKAENNISKKHEKKLKKSRWGVYYYQ